MGEQEQNKNVPSPTPFIFKGWLIGVSIGAPIGIGLGCCSLNNMAHPLL